MSLVHDEPNFRAIAALSGLGLLIFIGALFVFADLSDKESSGPSDDLKATVTTLQKEVDRLSHQVTKLETVVGRLEAEKGTRNGRD